MIENNARADWIEVLNYNEAMLALHQLDVYLAEQENSNGIFIKEVENAPSTSDSGATDANSDFEVFVNGKC
jgi:hypothetical protein